MQLAEPLTSSANSPQPASTHSEEGRGGQSCDRAVPSCRVLNCSSPVPRAGGTGDFPDMRLPIVNKSPKTAKNVSAESVVCFGSGQKWSNIRGAGTLPLFVSIAFSKCTENALKARHFGRSPTASAIRLVISAINNPGNGNKLPDSALAAAYGRRSAGSIR